MIKTRANKVTYLRITRSLTVELDTRRLMWLKQLKWWCLGWSNTDPQMAVAKRGIYRCILTWCVKWWTSCVVLQHNLFILTSKEGNYLMHSPIISEILVKQWYSFQMSMDLWLIYSSPLIIQTLGYPNSLKSNTTIKIFIPTW